MHMNQIFRLISVVLASMLITTCALPVSATSGVSSPGATTCELSRDYLLSQNNAELQGEDLVFGNGGGDMTFDFLLPFDSNQIVLKYETGNDTVIDVQIDGVQHVIGLSASEKTATVAIDEKYGSHTVRIGVGNAVRLTGINFVKIVEDFNEKNGLITELSDYDDALLNSVVFHMNADIVKSKGAIRRLDYNNLSLKPRNIDGSMYVPLSVLAAELGFYCEDYADKSYILVRGEEISLEMVAGKGILSEDLAGDTDVEMNVVYSDGITWVPLRAFAETMKFYVAYRDGYAVVDDRLCARKVVKDEDIFSWLCDEFRAYIGEVKTGTTYHVAVNHKNASDANSGTETYPFKTLQKAGEVAQAGDTVIVHEGIYREVLKPQNNGTALAPITFCAAEGETVTISALEPIQNFIKLSDSTKNIYYASVTKDLGEGRNQLFYKGEALTEGRHPNTNTKVTSEGAYGKTDAYPTEVPNIWATKGDISIKVDNKNNTQREGFNVATSDTDLNQEKDYWKGGTFVSLKGEAWTLVSGDIVSSEKGKIVVKDHEGSKSYNLGIDGLYYRFVHKPDYGYITNHLNTVDMPGEWYIGENVVYVCPPEGANLSEDFEVKQRQQVIDLRDKKFITVKGMNTIGGGVTVSGDNAEGNVLDGNNFRWISHFTKMIDQQDYLIDPNENRYTKDNSVTRGEVGISLSGKNNAVINSDIEYSAGAGVYLTGLNHYVYNNIIGNTSYGGGYPGAININRMFYEDPLGAYGGHVIRNNTMYNSGRALVNMASEYIQKVNGKWIFIEEFDATGETFWAPYVANELAYNRIYQGCLTSRDTGITYQYGYTGGNDKRRTQIHHNYVYDLMNWDRKYDPYNAATNPDGIGTGNSHVYQDGFTCNQDTYCNLSFQTFDIGIGNNGGIYEQEQPWTQVRMRSNKDLHDFAAGLSGLTNESFPSGKPFFAGSYRDGRERFMMNYNNLEAGIKAYTPDTSDTVTSSWNFSDVKISSSGYTLLSVEYVRDSVENVIFTASASLTDQSGNVVSQVTMPITTESAENGDSKLKTASIVIPNENAGVYDVCVSFEDEHSTALRLRTDKGDPAMRLVFDPEVIYAGSYDSWIEGKSTGEIYPLSKKIETNKESLQKGTYYWLANTWTHTVVYENRTVEEDSDTLEIALSTGSPYDGQTVEIYADSMQGEPLAKIVSEDSGWSLAKKTVHLANTLSAGEHTFYVKFGGTNKCSNFYYFDFYNSTAKTNEK